MSRPSEHRRVVVIGGGVAGLATAALLAADGHQVDLLERSSALGGRAGSWERDGFRFDTGPSWYLMPEVFDHLFRLLGTSAEAELDLVHLDPGYRVWFEGHPDAVDIAADRPGNVALFESLEPGAGAALERYLDSAELTYDLALRHFLYTSFQSPTSLLAPQIARHAPTLAGLLTRSLESFVGARFQDRRLRQVLGYPAVFLGTAPDKAPSMYHLMSHLDLADGVYHPRGGFHRVVEVLASLAERAGARLHTGVEVTGVRTAPGGSGRRRRAHVTGVDAVRDGTPTAYDADLVVGAGDLHHLETRLLPRELQTFPESWWSKRDPGPGAVLAMLGIEGELPELAHHSLFFTRDWQQNFGDVFDARRVPEPASAYVCKPSATDDDVAPPGHENLFVLVPVPAETSIGRGGEDGAGDPQVEKAADAAIAQVAAWAGVPDLAERIVVRRTVGPGDFADDVLAWRGGALGPAHVLSQSAMFRAGNASKRVDGLLYAGSSTLPGIGVPMCLISAELVLKRLRGDRSAGPVDVPR